MAKLTHLDDDGNAVMVDVSDKASTERTATAKGSVFMAAQTMALIIGGGMCCPSPNWPGSWPRKERQT